MTHVCAYKSLFFRYVASGQHRLLEELPVHEPFDLFVGLRLEAPSAASDRGERVRRDFIEITGQLIEKGFPIVTCTGG